jgi:hypothetical protein
VAKYRVSTYTNNNINNDDDDDDDDNKNNNNKNINSDRAVSIATGYGLDDRGVGVRVPVGSRIFTPPARPDRLCGPPSLLSNGYRGIFLRG